MRTMKQILLVLMTVFMIFGCSRNCGLCSPNSNTIEAGNLPDGSAINISQSFFILNAGAEETATVYFFWANSNSTAQVSFTPPEGISVTPNNCLLDKGNTSCEIVISVANTTSNGVYQIPVTVVTQDGITTTLAPLYILVSNTSSNSSKDITTFIIDGVLGHIVDNVISITLPYGVSRTSLVAAYATSGSYVTVNNVVQQNGYTINDFSTPVTYTVHALDGSTHNYNVIVNNAQSNSNDITYFSLNGTQGIINDDQINVIMPFGTSLTALAATYVTTGESIKVNGVEQENGLTVNNFSSSVQYTVTAEDGTTKTYTVNVVAAQDSSKSIESFSLNGLVGTIDGLNITVNLPFNLSPNSLIATYITDGVSVKVNGVTQQNGVTVNNFNNPVQYVVTAADGSTNTYVVTVNQLTTDGFMITGGSQMFTQFNTLNNSYRSLQIPNTFYRKIIQTSTGRLINIGSSSTIEISDDGGTSWSSVPSGIVTNLLSDIAITSTGRIIIVGTSGNILISDDNGDTWSLVASGTANNLSAIAINSLGRIVVAGANSTIITSDDNGNTWTPRTVPAPAVSFSALVVNSANIFIAVAGTGVIRRSVDDGNTWSTNISTGAGPLNGAGVVPSTGTFILVGSGGTIRASTNNQGTSYTGLTSGVASALNGVTINSSGVFIVTGVNGVILRSTDGVNFSTISSGVTSNLQQVSVINGTQFIIAGDTADILFSIDGTSWTPLYDGRNVSINKVIMNYQREYLAVGGSGLIITSSDGASWVQQSSGTAVTLNGAALSLSGTYVVVGNTGTILTSTDRVTWTPRTSGTTNNLFGVTFDFITNKFFAVGASGTIRSSGDEGLTWQTVTSGSGFQLNSICSNNQDGTLIATGQNGTFLTSTNGGIIWTSANISGNNNLLNIIARYNGGYVIAASSNIYTSPDGVTWTSAIATGANAVAETTSHVFMAVGNTGLLLKSVDEGATWTQVLPILNGIGLNSLVAN